MVRIRLFFLMLEIIKQGGLAKTDTWRKKEALEDYIG